MKKCIIQLSIGFSIVMIAGLVLQYISENSSLAAECLGVVFFVIFCYVGNLERKIESLKN